MTTIKKSIRRFSIVTINAFVIFLLISTATFAQDSPYQAIRLNGGNPIIEPSMFSNGDDGDNINGPSLIRIPDWISTNNRANASARYYLYFADHVGDYIRMAWAANIEGPYTLYNDSATPGDRGVLDNNESDIFLDNNIRIEENHLASPDVIVDDENQRIIMYFHSGSSYFVDGEEQNDQVTWVSTSPYGLEFYNDIKSVHLGSSYFRVFEYDNELYALDNGAKINRALDADNPWAVPSGHDFTTQLWDKNPNHVFQDDITVPIAELRVRHTGAHVVGNQLHVFYSRRGDLQERIQLSTIDMRADWTQWDPTYPAIEVLAPNPGWEGGSREMENSEASAGTDVNQLRDPDVFEDTDGQLYLLYTGDGEGGIGIAKLYETPEIDITLTTIADAHIKETASSSNYGSLTKVRTSIGSSSSDSRTIYMQFDLSQVEDLGHAVVRLYANKTTEGPVTVYETSKNWQENSITAGNAPSLGQAITTTYLTNNNQYYDWNITEYAKANTGSIISVAFNIAPSNEASHEFGSLQGSNPAQLLLSSDSDITNTGSCGVLIDENNFNSSYGIWNSGGSDCRRSSKDASFANGGSGKCIRLRDNSNTSLITTDDLDLSAYTEITVNFNYIADLVESGEDFWLQISTNGGNTYETVGDWNAGDEFDNGIRYFESVTIDGSFPTNTRLRFRMDASTNADYIYIDDVKITGCSMSSVSKIAVSAISAPAKMELTTYPNPFSDNFTIEIPNYDEQSAVVVELFSLSSRTIVSKETYTQSVIEITNTPLSAGVCILMVSYNNGETLIKKMIKVD